MHEIYARWDEFEQERRSQAGPSTWAFSLVHGIHTGEICKYIFMYSLGIFFQRIVAPKSHSPLQHLSENCRAALRLLMESFLIEI